MTRARALAARAFAILEPLCVTEEQKQSLFVLSAALRAERNEALETAANVIKNGQETFGPNGPHLSPRIDGNVAGLPYATAIRALMDKPASAEPKWPDLDPELKITREEMIEMFGGTFHDFDAWLATRPDLEDAGTARQLNEYARDRKPPDPTRALAWLFKKLWNAGYDGHHHPFNVMVGVGLLKIAEASLPDAGYEITNLGRSAIALTFAKEPKNE